MSVRRKQSVRTPSERNELIRPLIEEGFVQNLCGYVLSLPDVEGWLDMGEAVSEGNEALVDAGDFWESGHRGATGQPVKFRTYAYRAVVSRVRRACYLEGYTYEEAGREFGITRQRVWQLLSRNLKRMRRTLAKAG